MWMHHPDEPGKNLWVGYKCIPNCPWKEYKEATRKASNNAWALANRDKRNDNRRRIKEASLKLDGHITYENGPWFFDENTVGDQYRRTCQKTHVQYRTHGYVWNCSPLCICVECLERLQSPDIHPDWFIKRLKIAADAIPQGSDDPTLRTLLVRFWGDRRIRNCALNLKFALEEYNPNYHDTVVNWSRNA